MAKQEHDPYEWLGGKDREPPQITMARQVLGIPREISREQIKKEYRKKAKETHTDTKQHLLDESSLEKMKDEFQLVSSAYKLLTDDDKQEDAAQEFKDALSTPFQVGKRIFSLGQLYGVRIYIHKTEALAANSKLLLLTGKTEKSVIRGKDVNIYGSRQSILESNYADAYETIYGGSDWDDSAKIKAADAMKKLNMGGIDELIWVRSNDLGVYHFLKRDFEEGAKMYKRCKEEIPSNVLFRYRYGLCLEAMVSIDGYNEEKKDKWEFFMRKAINLYDSCVHDLKKHRKYSWPEPGKLIQRYDPRSTITVLMQLADAYEAIGDMSEAKKIWHELKDNFPDCYEAAMKLREMNAGKGRIFLLGKKIAGLLTES